MTSKIRVGLVGVGNNASAMVQGVYYYSDADGADAAANGREGIRFPALCGYKISDIEFSSAFDVDARKVGLDLGQAIFSEPNRYPHVLADAPLTGVVVQGAPVLDGVPIFLAEMVEVAAESSVGQAADLFDTCVRSVRESNTEVLVNFLPSGSDQATEFFARVAAHGGAAYVNCTPSPAAHSPEILKLFEKVRLPLLGDDLESQFGSSLLHRTLLNALQERGLEIVHSYQINLGGNADFKNLSHRSEAKKRSKQKAISTVGLADRIDILPSGGFISGLGDNKVGYMVIGGRGWLNMPVTIDLKLKVQDSSNAIGVTVDLVRLARGARDRQLSGYVPLSYYFKNPLGNKLATEQALAVVEQFDRGESIDV